MGSGGSKTGVSAKAMIASKMNRTNVFFIINTSNSMIIQMSRYINMATIEGFNEQEYLAEIGALQSWYKNVLF
jgi:hypothetical protein